MMGAMGGILIGVFYLVFGVIYIIPTLQLHRYANAIARLGQGGGTPAIEAALMHQRSFWRTVGILMLVVLVIWVLAVAIGIVVGLAAAVSGM